MDEIEIRQKYSHYTLRLLSSLLHDDAEISVDEQFIIRKMIAERSIIENNDIIFDGGIKDKIILLSRWHILIFFAGYILTFIFKENSYIAHWSDSLVYYILSITSGFILTVLAFVFFTRKLKDKFINTFTKISAASMILIYIGEWNMCRLNYC